MAISVRRVTGARSRSMAPNRVRVTPSARASESWVSFIVSRRRLSSLPFTHSPQQPFRHHQVESTFKDIPKIAGSDK
jgi:hypothetical protein